MGGLVGSVVGGLVGVGGVVVVGGLVGSEVGSEGSVVGVGTVGPWSSAGGTVVLAASSLSADADAVVAGRPTATTPTATMIARVRAAKRRQSVDICSEVPSRVVLLVARATSASAVAVVVSY